MADIVDDAEQVLRKVVPGLPERVYLQWQVEVRQLRGGTEAGYVSHRYPLQRQFMLEQHWQSQRPLDEFRAATNTSSATFYRDLNRKRRRNSQKSP
jgi:hypothetical protein